MPASEPVSAPPAPPAVRPSALVVRVLLVRLRFLAVPLVAFVLVASWPVLHTTWDKLTRTASSSDLEGGPVSTDTEYFCPMDPGVVSDWPGKCPVCNMSLVPRKRGEAAVLPDGVVARMQLSPYRIELAGIQTAEVAYRPLLQEIETAGVVEADEHRSVDITAPAAGVVRRVLAGPVGGLVKKGEPLVLLANAEPLSPGQVEALRQRLHKEGVAAEDLKLSPGGGSPDSFELTLRVPTSGQLTALPIRKGETVAAGALLGGVTDLSRVCVPAEVFDRDVPFLAEGQAVAVSAEAVPGHAPFAGTVRQLVTQAGSGRCSLRALLDVENPDGVLRPGFFVSARLKMPVQQTEPFRALPTGTPAISPGEPRQVYVCPNHPEHLSDSPGRCPHDQKELEPRPLAANQRLGWWCPMHPKVTADKPGAVCPECGGLKLEPRIITYSPPGQVLAVPESAVVDTGARKVVYVERMPGMFDGVEVVLGRRCGDFYPVVRGLAAGDRVVSAGAFLIDAETRLNPSVAAGYFGAGRTPGTAPEHSWSSTPTPEPATSESATIAEALGHLSAEDRALAEKQKVCPVTGQPLGSMGPPPAVTVEGRKVFLCCKGCAAALRKDPGKYLKQLDAK